MEGGGRGRGKEGGMKRWREVGKDEGRRERKREGGGRGRGKEGGIKRWEVGEEEGRREG